MLKHTAILEKMSAKQKIALLANLRCLADEEYAKLGIPRVQFVTLDELFTKDGDGLTPYALARCWDPAFIRKTTEQIIRRNCGDANVVIATSPKINLGGEAQLALSEDPLLSTQITLAFLSAINDCGKSAVVPDFCLTKKEVANMDIKPDARALHDFVYQPFSDAAKQGNVKAVIGSISKNAGAYEDFNRTLIRRKDDYFGPEMQMLCVCKTYDETLAALEENCIIFSGVEIAIQNAYEQYQSLLSAIEKGRASMLNLEEAFEHKTALSDQMLNAAVEKVIDFSYRILGLDPDAELYIDPTDEIPVEPMEEVDIEPKEQADIPQTEKTPAAIIKSVEEENLITLAMQKSTVLLKNKTGLLPLVKNKTFAIIGDAALSIEKGETTSFADYFKSFAPNKCVGTARGYNLLEDRNDDLIAPAVALAETASTVFVFLKPRPAQNVSFPCTSLPANQAALISALSKCKCNVIAVLCSDTNIDVSFSAFADGVLLAPVAGKLSAKALAEIAFKKTSPGGKLTVSFYASPNKFYKKQRFYKDTGRNKVSIFIGYRFYDTQDIALRYPFGFGLKYSNVQITNVRLTAGNLSFTIINTSPNDLDETVQIYVGMAKSRLLRPKKELKAFRTLHLKAGKSEQVTIKNLDFTIYEETTKSNVVESGFYTVYLGTSVNNIKTTTTGNMRGKIVASTPPKLADYLQSKTNIISNDFTLEAKHKKMANYKGLKNAGFICLLIAAVVGLMSISAAAPLIPLIISAVIFLGAVAFFAASRNLKRRVKFEEAKLVEKNKKLFQEADSTAMEKLEDLFLKEFKFDVSDAAVTAEQIDENYVDANVATLNDNMSFSLAAADLKKSLGEFGVTIDSHYAASTLASFVSSKLILAKPVQRETFDNFVAAVANYFGANLFTETVTDMHDPADRLLYATTFDGPTRPTSVLNALLSAQEKTQAMHIVHLRNLPVSRISEYLIPYIKYFSNPHSSAEISAKGSDDVYVIPSNVWFIIELEQGALVENVPAYVLEYATLLPVKHADCQPAEIKSEIVPITLTDFDFLQERCKTKFTINEDVWKKIDSIESFVFKHAAYKIGNKLWLRIETYIATLLSMQIDLPVAVDSALACVILPTLASVLTGKLTDTDKTLIEEMERVFGEDNVQISHEMLVSKA